MNRLLSQYRFRLLFSGTLLALFVLGFPEPPRALQFGAILLLIATGLNTLRHHRLLLGLALFFSICELVVQLELFGEHARLRGLSLIAFYLVLLSSLFHHVTQQRPVTRELLYGFCALYLQLGLAFALSFAMLNLLFPGSFAGTGAEPHLDTFVYFSLATLTTVGYGDIHALSPLARMLAASEGVAGVFFIALAVARVINMLNDNEAES